MIEFTPKYPGVGEDHHGLIPYFLEPTDPRPAREQFAEAYAHGGGWTPFQGFTMRDDGSILYPGDPALPVYFEGNLPLTRETIRVYPHAWVAIIQADGEYEICRMD